MFSRLTRFDFRPSRDDTQILTTKVKQTTANISLYMVPILQGVQSRMVLVVNIYVFVFFFSFAVAICDVVHNVEAKHDHIRETGITHISKKISRCC